MGKTQSNCLTLALTKTLLLLIMLSGSSTKAQVLKVEGGVFKDISNVVTPVITGGTVVANELVFGNTAGNMIRIPDNGTFSFDGGFTIQAEVYFEQTPNFGFAFKFGSFSVDLINGKLNSSWMTFPSEPIFTTNATQFKYFPVGTELLHGYQVLPLNEWVKLEISYDESLGITTTKINDVVDRILVRYRGSEHIGLTSNQSIRILENGKNVRIRNLVVREGQPATTPTFNVNANGLPFQNRVQLTFDQIDKRLPLPISFTVLQMRPGQLTRSFNMKLNSHARKDTLIPMLGWTGQPMTIKIKNQLIDKDFEIVNRVAANPFTGKKFPIVMYHAQAEDFRQLNSMGFNVVQNDFNVMSSGLPTGEIQQSLDSANKYGMGVYVVANSGDVKLSYVSRFSSHPSLYGWYLADEPGGADLLERMREFNNGVKITAPAKPTMIMMNNFNRLTGLDCDIIGVDPFPIPNVSMRMVVDAVKAGLRASAGNKPVLCLIPHFTGKIPTREELKIMVWLGIMAGAHGVGMFEWDHRSPSTPTGYYAGANPAHVANISSVFKEVRSWDFMLSAATTTYPTGNLAVHAATKTANGKTWLMLGNDSRKIETAIFSVNGKTISVVLNPHEVQIKDLATIPAFIPLRKATQGLELNGEQIESQWVNYRIQFHNQSTSPEKILAITDSLSPFVDPATIELGFGSHACQIVQDEKDPSVIRFEFQNLQLPSVTFSGTSTEGFIDFRVRLKEDLAAGTEVINKALLAFENSGTISSNISIFKIGVENSPQPLVPESNQSFRLFPNPGVDMVHLMTDKEGQLTMFDMAGRTVDFSVVQGANTLDFSNQKPGLYILKLNGQTLRWVKR